MIARELWVAPGQIHDYQSDVWNDDSRLVVVKKSRRIGITWALLGRAVLKAISTGRSTYYISQTFPLGKEAVRDVEWWADQFEMAAKAKGLPSIWPGGNKRNGLSRETVRFASGGKFAVLASRPSNLRGIPGTPDYLLDEMAFHREPKEMLAAARPILMRPMGQVTVVSTVMYEDVFWELCEEARAEEVAALKEGRRPSKRLHTITFDDALEDGIQERDAWMVAEAVAAGEEAPAALVQVQSEALARHLEGIVGPEKMEEFWGDTLWSPTARMDYRADAWRKVSEPDRELNCIPSQNGAEYMPVNIINAAMDADLNVFRYEGGKDLTAKSADAQLSEISEWMAGPGRVLESLRTLPKRRWYYGVDFGRSRDLTVISLGYIDGKDLVVPFMLELDNVAYRAQAMFFDQLTMRLDLVAGGALDRGGGGQSLVDHAQGELGEHRAEPITMGRYWYLEHMPNFKRRFQDATIKIPDDDFLLGDLRQIKLVRGVPMIPRGERVGAGMSLDGNRAKFRHGDGAVSLALLNYACRNHVANGGGYKSHRVGRPKNRRIKGLG